MGPKGRRERSERMRGTAGRRFRPKSRAVCVPNSRAVMIRSLGQRVQAVALDTEGAAAGVTRPHVHRTTAAACFPDCGAQAAG